MAFVVLVVIWTPSCPVLHLEATAHVPFTSVQDTTADPFPVRNTSDPIPSYVEHMTIPAVIMYAFNVLAGVTALRLIPVASNVATVDGIPLLPVLLTTIFPFASSVSEILVPATSLRTILAALSQTSMAEPGVELITCCLKRSCVSIDARR